MVHADLCAKGGHLMKKLVMSLAALGLIGAALPSATAGPGALGISSDNIEQVGHVPFEKSTSRARTSGARAVTTT